MAAMATMATMAAMAAAVRMSELELRADLADSRTVEAAEEVKTFSAAEVLEAAEVLAAAVAAADTDTDINRRQ